MKATSWALLSIAGVMATVILGAPLLSAPLPPDEQGQRDRMQADFRQGNFKDAYDGLRKLILDPNAAASAVGGDLNLAVDCLQRLGRVDEIDALLEKAVETHRGNWRLLWSAATRYMNIPHHGFIVAGQFERGNKRGGGHIVNAAERDRVRSLQLMVQAMPSALEDDDHGETANFLLALAGMLLNDRGYSEAWRLQYLTDLDALPDYEEGWGYGRSTAGAPVGPEGQPVFYDAPKTFGSAANDGQRWRWCLRQAAEMNPRRRDAVRLRFAEFLRDQFGVQTMAEWGWRFGRMAADDTESDESGTFAFHTLGENETIARLATGIKRFELPDEFNYIKILQAIGSASRSGHAVEALEQLAQIFENRRQYPKAASYWRRLLEEFPDQNARRRAGWKQRLDQIVGNWGRFESACSQPAGRGATVEYRFRNGRQVNFTAYEIKVEKLLNDIKAFLKSNPRRLDWQKANIGDIGHRLVVDNQRQYLGEKVAEWQTSLDPREEHFDKRITVTSPLQRPGAYLVKAQMLDGNTSFIVLWIDDTAIIEKPLEGRSYYFVADAVSGEPVAGASLEFFGWRMTRQDRRRRQVVVKQFAENSDADGQVMLDPKRQPANMQWLVIARAKGGRFAYLGFDRVWYGRRHDAEYNAVRAYAITDRPVYRPDQTVHYKFWVRRAKYDMGDTSEFAGREFVVEVRNPRGDKAAEHRSKADAFGGVEGEYIVPADATLGVYYMLIHSPDGKQHYGHGSFRVEEYKKPEFEVIVDGPAEPVMLGDKINATIRAKYYFGSPVTNAKVKYTVKRSEHDGRWYPAGQWDWLYGPGYWWFACDYDWYPGWNTWGCPRPTPFWWPRQTEPPEVVAEREVEIGPDGTVDVEIDTGAAKVLYPDQDHVYTITAEVVDQSRRTIVGSGSALVARRPFAVRAWLDRGYYRVGDTIEAHFSALTPDGKPVQGKGELTLLKINYRDGKPVETPLQTWRLDTDAAGEASRPLTASQAGQYRLSYKLTADARRGEDEAEKEKRPQQTIEGGYFFTVVGEGFDGAQFRFNHLELIPDKREYAPGDKIRLQINTDHAGGTVLLFARPANGVYLPPKVIRLDGKSTIETIGVARKDMPNFFVEAVAVADGRVHTEVKEIVVPPEQRILNVEISPSKDAYKPGERAKAKIKLTDLAGKPFVGSTVVAIYDKALEYISGGSNVADIKEFFWKWRRHHHSRTESSLDRWFGNLSRPKAADMEDLGVFGDTVVDDLNGMATNGDAAVQGDLAMGWGGRGIFRKKAMSGEVAASMPARAPGLGLADKEETFVSEEHDMGGETAMVEPVVRTKFADTALWIGALTTNEDGTADVSLAMPENLTTWRIKVWGMGQGTRVGQGFADVVTRKDLIVRLQAPRFFVQTDEVVLSAIVHNYLETKKNVTAALELDGECLEVIGKGDKLDPKPGHPVRLNTGKVFNQPLEVAANGEARVDWRVKVLNEGEAVIRVKALTDEESDAMEQRFPCYVHGMLKTESYSGSLRPRDAEGKFVIHVPADRRPKDSRLDVRFSPTLAGAMVEALPYMVEYPYGCTEQTLNRFLPTVVVQKTLLDMRLNLKAIERRRAARPRMAEIQSPFSTPPVRNPVFDEDEVRKMVRDGVEALTEMQCSDGGWGWFSGWGERSTPHTTALVVHGLQIAQSNDVALVPGVLERGVKWLERYQDKQVELLKNAAIADRVDDRADKPPHKDCADNIDAFVYMVLVDAGVENTDMLEFLYRDRTDLAVYGMAMYGLALERQGERDKLAMILRNIGQYVEQDDENQTAWLRLPGDCWWRWYGSEFETQAYYLKLLARTDPKGELAPRLVKYLLNNRRHAVYWNSTRDTAICVEAMADFIRASGEDRPDMTVEVYYDGELKKTVEITPENLFLSDNAFVLEGDAVASGDHTVELKKKGKGPLYFSGYLTTFTLEDFIKRAGLEVKVNRKYYKLVKTDASVHAAGSRGQAVEQKVEKFERRALKNLAELKSGDLVEIELEIESKNDYEYLIFEDMKPSGFEPVEVRSGYDGNSLGAYVEYRDNRVVFFVRELARGRHSVSYRMRAEVPGRFSALPACAGAMYAPDLKANSDELKLRVVD